MLHVSDVSRAKKFYTDVLGMKVLRTTDRPEQKYTLAFVGAAVVPVACGWSDVGSWLAVWELSDKDADGNAAQGQDDAGSRTGA